ncbi:MAG: leucine-rich repeat domain-containing protein [Clostridia bacterium]|nr:leucine-rich repeat domain-containing protein [Clostridia bacterium]
MRKRFLIVFLSIIALVSLLLIVTACDLSSSSATGDAKNKAKINIEIKKAFENVPLAKNVVVNAVDKTITFTVDNDTSEFNWSTVDMASSTFAVYTDAGCKNSLTGLAELEEGENTFYIIVTKDTVNVTYKVRITREKSYYYDPDEDDEIIRDMIPCEGLEYVLKTDDTYEVVGMGTCTDIELVIPATYEGKAVTSIGRSAFYDCASLTMVVIPDSLTSIGNNAFENCRGLTSVYYAKNSRLTTIGEEAFVGCSALQFVKIPKSVTEIGDFAFICGFFINESTPPISSFIDFYVEKDSRYFSSVNGVLYSEDKKTLIQYPIGRKDTSFTVPSGVGIGEFAFAGSILKEIVIPEGTETISEGCLEACFLLEKLYLPSTLKEVKKHEAGSLKMKEIHFLGDIAGWCQIDGLYYIMRCLTNYGEADFTLHINGAPITGAIVIPGNVPTIKEYAFYGCRDLTSVTISEGVKEIEPYAFAKCEKLNYVKIPNSITSIGEKAFDGTAARNACDDATNRFLIKDNKVYDYDQTLVLDYGKEGYTLEHKMNNTIIFSKYVDVTCYKLSWARFIGDIYTERDEKESVKCYYRLDLTTKELVRIAGTSYELLTDWILVTTIMEFTYINAYEYGVMISTKTDELEPGSGGYHTRDESYDYYKEDGTKIIRD